MRQLILRAGMLSGVLLLAACALMPGKPRSPLPVLHLSPGSFGGSVNLTQRLQLVAADNAKVRSLAATKSLDALLEIDQQEVLLAAFVASHRLLTLRWRDDTLSIQQDHLIPLPVDPERILRDIQLAYWPSAAIRAVLPAGWQLDDTSTMRTLLQNGDTKVRISYNNSPHWQGAAELDNLAEGYRLRIESAVQEP